MGKTADQLTAEELETYRAAARQRQLLQTQKLAERKQLAWNVAREAADFLRRNYGVSRVVLFGSLLNDRRFTEFSDVDIAVWGLPTKQSLSAMGDLWHLGLSRGMPIQLVDISMCRDDLLQNIQREGVDL